jgi:DNA-binding XRE family transcriptional regulator
MPIGRPSKYRGEYVEQARKLCLLGATDAQLADFFGVSTQTLNAWKHEYPDFLDSLKGAKIEADERVERSLYERATGYSYQATKVMQYEGKPVLAHYTEHVPPDPTSMIFWLKNRQPGRWRDRMDLNHSVNIDLTGEIEQRLAEGKKRALALSALTLTAEKRSN